MIPRKLMIPKYPMIQRKFQCMDFDNSKLYGATSINDGLDVIFFCILLVFSTIDCGR